VKLLAKLKQTFLLILDWLYKARETTKKRRVCALFASIGAIAKDALFTSSLSQKPPCSPPFGHKARLNEICVGVSKDTHKNN